MRNLQMLSLLLFTLFGNNVALRLGSRTKREPEEITPETNFDEVGDEVAQMEKMENSENIEEFYGNAMAVTPVKADRGHVDTQEHLFIKLKELWGTEKGRVFMDLGCSIGHGLYRNYSDMMLFLDHFNASGTHAIGVDPNPYFAQDVKTRLGQRPYKDARTTVLQKAITKDGSDIELDVLAPSSLCLKPNETHKFWVWRHDTIHSCTSMIKHEKDIRKFPKRKVSGITTDHLWEKHLKGKHVDFLKIDIDVPDMLGIFNRSMMSMIENHGFSVMTFEIDEVSYPRDFGDLLKIIDVLDNNDYIAYVKIPCGAEAARGHHTGLRDYGKTGLQPVWKPNSHNKKNLEASEKL